MPLSLSFPNHALLASYQQALSRGWAGYEQDPDTASRMLAACPTAASGSATANTAANSACAGPCPGTPYRQTAPGTWPGRWCHGNAATATPARLYGCCCPASPTWACRGWTWRWPPVTSPPGKPPNTSAPHASPPTRPAPNTATSALIGTG